jgi:hypothetical protein
VPGCSRLDSSFLGLQFANFAYGREPKLLEGIAVFFGRFVNAIVNRNGLQEPEPVPMGAAL